MFDGIAERYDLLNRLISFGVDRSWRHQTVEAVGLDAKHAGAGTSGAGTSSEANCLEGQPAVSSANSTATILDLATGTGDMAIALAARYPNIKVVGVDPSAGMMDVGRAKVQSKGLSQRVSFQLGDGQALSFDDRTFDGITMAFGIRNVPDRERALREMVRVCKPGAKVAILELSEPRKGVLGALGRFHMHQMVPLIGSLLSGSREYSYLPRSIAAFPTPKTFRSMMLDAGMHSVHFTALTFGVCHLYVGEA